MSAADAVALSVPEQERADWLGLIGALLLRPSTPLLQDLAAAPMPPMPHRPELDAAWRSLVQAARRCGPEGVHREHAALFVGVGSPVIDPCGSRYLGGALMDVPLVRLRADLRTLGMGRQPQALHTEDHLGALCESLRLLITGASGLPPQPLAVQHRFYAEHLAPWIGSCLHDVRDADGAVFYAAWADLAQAFFATEEDAMASSLGTPHPEGALPCRA